ncbi:NAD(P)/FAD-dependent oxidoreductase [Salinicola avicenniae]|uniref:NAD(P)/FAD-dependent oxidoreductase n=1 Tax=Salinicola avicenniae TaxID=2916836 RepID=UPI0020732B6F|nr:MULTISPECIES: FAD-binding oxidoreductase [unclassified Salinicola]
MRVDHPRSYYAASANAAPVRPPLTGGKRADVCVIGGGFTGLSSALHLAERGFDVTLLEASRIGFGASGRNGGQIVNSYSRDMDVIEAKYGGTTARALGSMAFEGAQIIRERVATYDIACDLKAGNLFAACTDKQMRGLVAHKALWERYGHSALSLLDSRTYRDEIGSPRYVGALLDQAGGHLHPLNLALGEAAAFEALGGTIHEASPVVELVHGAPARVRTAQGEIRADHVIVAGNAYLSGLLPALEGRSMPCGTQMIATTPLEASVAHQLLPHDRCVEDSNYLLDYYRLSAGRRLLYGGGVTYGGGDPASIEASIRPNLERTFPQLRGIKFDYAWSGNFLLTLNRLPQFGRINGNVLYAQGYSGHGLTCTHLAGRLMAEVLCGEHDRFDAFAGIPHTPFPGGRLFRVPLTTLGAWFYRLRDRLGG